MPNTTSIRPTSMRASASLRGATALKETPAQVGWSPERDFKWRWLQGKMLELGYTPRSLASVVGVSNNTVYEWLTGVKLPLRRANVLTLASVLEVEVKELLSTMPLE